MTILQQLVRFSFTLAFLAIALLLNVGYGFSTYMGLRSGILLLNLDAEPAAHLALGGQFFTAFAPKAGQQDYFAMFIAFGLTAVYILVAHQIMIILGHRRDIRAYAAVGNTEFERMARVQLRSAWEYMAVVGLVAGVALALEMGLFLYRSVAGAQNIDMPELAIGMPGFGQIDYAGKLVGQIGCVAAPALPLIGLGLALLYEFIKIRLQNHFEALAEAFRAALDFSAPREESLPQAESVRETAQPTTEVLPEEPRPQAPAPAKAQEAKAELHDVIGRPGVQVSMAEALDRPDLYVVTENYEIWDRSYHQGIHKPADR